MDTLIRGYSKKETPPKPPVHIDLSGVINCLEVHTAWNTAGPKDIFRSANYFVIPAQDLAPGEVYTMTIPKAPEPDEVYIRDLAGNPHLWARTNGCQGFYPQVVNAYFGTSPEAVGSTAYFTARLNNANVKFILHCNAGRNQYYRRYTVSVEVSPA